MSFPLSNVVRSERRPRGVSEVWSPGNRGVRGTAVFSGYGDHRPPEERNAGEEIAFAHPVDAVADRVAKHDEPINVLCPGTVDFESDTDRLNLDTDSQEGVSHSRERVAIPAAIVEESDLRLAICPDTGSDLLHLIGKQ